MFECRFGRGYDESLIIGVYKTEKEANAAWYKYLKEHFNNLIIYYTREYTVDGVKVIDFGSWTHFVYIKETNKGE